LVMFLGILALQKPLSSTFLLFDLFFYIKDFN
jgi:hypothetical protein